MTNDTGTIQASDNDTGSSADDTGAQQSNDDGATKTEYISSADNKSELFGKNYSEVSYEDMHLEEPFLGKFETLGDIEKGYKELSQKVREKHPEAPEEYAFDFSEHERLKDLSEDYNILEDPLMEAVMPIFKEHNISQDAATALTQSFLEWQLESMPTVEQEREKLGSEADAIIDEVSAFVGKFPESERATLEQIGTTADGVRLLQKLKHMMGEKSVPGDVPRNQVDPAELWHKAQEYKKNAHNFMSNPQAQAEYDRLADIAVKAELAAKRK